MIVTKQVNKNKIMHTVTIRAGFAGNRCYHPKNVPRNARMQKKIRKKNLNSYLQQKWFCSKFDVTHVHTISTKTDDMPTDRIVAMDNAIQKYREHNSFMECLTPRVDREQGTSMTGTYHRCIPGHLTHV